MRPEVRERLLDVNRAFYQSLGEAFAASRPRPQPGVERALAAIPRDASVIDVGCGHGLAARALAARGHTGPYVGIDGSAALLEHARRHTPSPWASFRFTDLARPGWADSISDRFDWALVFSVLHHFPSEDLRRRLGRAVRGLLRADGRAAVSVWEFPNSPRLLLRKVEWGEIGLAESDVEAGDALLDWRRGGYGLRYVHHLSSAELSRLAAASGFAVDDEYPSDGEGGRLGLYQVWSVSASVAAAPW